MLILPPYLCELDLLKVNTPYISKMGKKLNILSNTTWVMLTLIRACRHYTWERIGLLFEINFTKCSNLYFFFVSVCQSPKKKIKNDNKKALFELNTFICLFCIFFQKVIVEFKGGELHKVRAHLKRFKRDV